MTNIFLETYIILFGMRGDDELPLYDRKDAEHIENMQIEVDIGDDPFLVIRRKIQDFIGDDDSCADEMEIWPITDFMDSFNNQELNPDDYFMSYVNVIKK